MNINCIKKIINEWDPVNLFPAAPENEYSVEISKICKIIGQNKNISEIELANHIKKIFVDSFGTCIFKAQEKDCLMITNSIKKCLNKK